MSESDHPVEEKLQPVLVSASMHDREQVPESESLQERVRKLEQTVAVMSNRELLDQLINQKVNQRLHEQQARLESKAPQGFAPLVSLLPALGLAGLKAEESAAETEAESDTDTASQQPTKPKSWWRGTFLRDFRLMVQMYVDPRYRLSRVGQFCIPGIFLGMIFNYFAFQYFCFVGIPVLTPVLERVLIITLSFLLFKLLLRETKRYEAVLDYLARFAK